MSTPPRPKDWRLLVDKYVKANLMEEEGAAFTHAAEGMEWSEILILMGQKAKEDPDYQESSLVASSPAEGVIIRSYGTQEPDGRFRITRRELDIHDFVNYLDFLALGRPIKLPYFLSPPTTKFDADAIEMLRDFISRARIPQKEYYATINAIVNEVRNLERLDDIKMYCLQNIRRINPAYPAMAYEWYKKRLQTTSGALRRRLKKFC